MTAIFDPSAENEGYDANEETPGGATTVVRSSSPEPSSRTDHTSFVPVVKTIRPFAPG